MSFLNKVTIEDLNVKGRRVLVRATWPTTAQRSSFAPTWASPRAPTMPLPWRPLPPVWVN